MEGEFNQFPLSVLLLGKEIEHAQRELKLKLCWKVESHKYLQNCCFFLFFSLNTIFNCKHKAAPGIQEFPVYILKAEAPSHDVPGRELLCSKISASERLNLAFSELPPEIDPQALPVPTAVQIANSSGRHSIPGAQFPKYAWNRYDLNAGSHINRFL